MPRKFLGERLESGVDFMRPSSWTLTADDLDHIPSNGYEIDEAPTYGIGSRISRKFGGTVRLRKRLESVPELFLHDFKKRPSGKRSKKPFLRRIEPLKFALPAVREEISKPLIQEDEIDKIFESNQVVMPVILGPPPCTVSAHDNGSVSSNEKLYDEIISAYGSTGHQQFQPQLNSEIDRVLEHISHKQIGKKHTPMLEPKIYDSELAHPTTPELHPPSPVMLEKISSPEYTGTSSSDRWSSGDEFSDLGSAILNIDHSQVDEEYVTASNSLRFSKSPQLERASPGTKIDIRPMKLYKTKVLPRTFVFEDAQESDFPTDEETPKSLEMSEVELLRMKIDFVDLQSCTSSIYSGR